MELPQTNLFGEIENDCQREWNGMPEYQNVKQEDPEITATFKFRNYKDFKRFETQVKNCLYDGERVFEGKQLKDKKSTWFPLNEKASIYRYVSKKDVLPRFPVYVVSKGRASNNPTSKALQKLGVPFKMIVEDQEHDEYARLIGGENLLVLPEVYKEDYDTFWDDDDGRTGPGPARNYAWDHSVASGFSHHWVMDDNIASFERMNRNRRIKCVSPNLFYACEDFVLRYENVAISGPQYTYFCPAIDARPPFKLNTRIYSCLLIKNDIPYRWRGRYNEDTDLSLRALKDGMCTVQFNFFLQEKLTTQKMGGGNTKEFYLEGGTKNKSQMLEDMHSDVAKVSWKNNRWHHHVDYRPFEFNILTRKQEYDVSPETNNYGIELKSV